ncbi:hypothetical protein OG552_21105 [Streptomyces sp. NBC_01476]|uniref:hypothetical protein n=1 Tax=Streptomyces sp. NBC_01476 TaxID=2903881 RepID=UPI002E2EFB6B|nr:hypothetical protein [Streptomyces sp. NBC_01476]
MTRNGAAWVGDEVRDENAEREGIVTDVRGGRYRLRALTRPGEWAADSSERLTVTVPLERGVGR